MYFLKLTFMKYTTYKEVLKLYIRHGNLWVYIKVHQNLSSAFYVKLQRIIFVINIQENKK